MSQLCTVDRFLQSEYSVKIRDNFLNRKPGEVDNRSRETRGKKNHFLFKSQALR